MRWTTAGQRFVDATYPRACRSTVMSSTLSNPTATRINPSRLVANRIADALSAYILSRTTARKTEDEVSRALEYYFSAFGVDKTHVHNCARTVGHGLLSLEADLLELLKNRG
jgi:hypothetical protein